jgi:hypothetical protein
MSEVKFPGGKTEVQRISITVGSGAPGTGAVSYVVNWDSQLAGSPVAHVGCAHQKAELDLLEGRLR